MRPLMLAALLLWTSTAHAVELPESQRTDDAKRWLAVAFIAEAGWANERHQDAKADHRAIFHVLARRWARVVEHHPRLTFERMIQNYVAAFDSRTVKGTRVRWLLSLQPGRAQEPAGWPQHLSWPRHRVWWVQAQERAARCIDGGACRNPYPKAEHWGGRMDIPKGCMVELPNVGTYNTFYRLDWDCIRRRRALRKTTR